MNYYHKSVLLKEALDALKIESGRKYIDATLGGGGHTEEVLNRGGIVLGIDQDQESIDFVSAKLQNPNLRVVKANFSEIDRVASENNFSEVWGIFFDLGVSSHQLDRAERGFSYLKKGPLDMRMDKGLGVKAADLVNALGRDELFEIFKKYGEERKTGRIVDLIIKRRKIAPFQTTDDLTLTLATAYGFKNVNDFARATSGKRVFQALRLVVNDELGSLEKALPKAFGLLVPGGRLVIITFHSLEDRIVKRAFIEYEKKGIAKIITKKPILPSEEEINLNSRSKGSKLRVLEKYIR
jgi:16S rRNA (cytosine1402-N4)-methyltransferase